VPDTPPVCQSDPSGWLRARVAELEADNARLRQAAADRDELAAAQLAVRDGQIQALLKQSAEPDGTVESGPAACGCCGHGLTDADALWMQKWQVFEAAQPPPSVVTEYQVLARQCPRCGEISVGLAPAGVTGRVQYGPLVHARVALAVCAHYLPVARAARLVAALTGVAVSAGFAAGVRGKAAALLGPFMDRDTSTSPARCTPGAGRTGCGTGPACTASTPAGRSGPAPWPTC
jgi:transposase